MPTFIRLALIALMLFTLSPVSPDGARAVLAQTDTTAATAGDLDLSFRDLGHASRTVRGMWGATDFILPIPHATTPITGSQLSLVFSHSELVLAGRSSMTIYVNGEPRADVLLGPNNARRATLTIPLPHAEEFIRATPQTANDPEEIEAEGNGAEGNGTETSNAQGIGVQDYIADGYFVQIFFHLRVTDELCEADNLPGQWAVIHPESHYALVTRPRASLPGLESVDRLLTPRTDRQYIPTLVIPEEPDAELLPALGLGAYYIGRIAAGVRADASITPTHTAPTNTSSGQTSHTTQPSVVVMTLQELEANAQWGDLVWDGEQFRLKSATNSVAPVTASLLALNPLPSAQLLVGGEAPQDLLTALEALLSPVRRPLLHGAHQVITEAAPVRGPVQPYWRAGPVTFAELGSPDARRVAGRGQHFIDYYFERPPGWELASGSTLDLYVTAAPGLQAHTSWIEASVNGVSLGAYPLPPQSAGPAHYRFNLLPEALNYDWGGRPVRELALQVRLMLDVPRVECEEFAQDSLWATVLPTSSWSLQAQPAQQWDLGRFPWPFLHAGQDLTGSRVAEITAEITAESTVENTAENITENMTGVIEPTYVILPSEPTQAEIAAGLQVMAAIGRWAGPETAVWPILTTADQVELPSGATILVGVPQRHTLLADLLDEEPDWPMDPDESGIVALGELPPAYALDADSGEYPGAGILLLGPSPWDAAAPLLVVSDYAAWIEATAVPTEVEAGSERETTTAHTGLMHAARALAVAQQTTQLRGEIAVIAPTIPVQILRDSRELAPHELFEEELLSEDPSAEGQQSETPAQEDAADAAASPDDAVTQVNAPPAIESPLAAQEPAAPDASMEMGRLGALAPWQVVGAVLLGMFIAVVSLLFYVRVRRKSPVT